MERQVACIEPIKTDKKQYDRVQENFNQNTKFRQILKRQKLNSD